MTSHASTPAPMAVTSIPPIDTEVRDQRLALLHDLIDSMPVCMVTTNALDGSIQSRPMLFLRMNPGGSLLFMTKLVSQKVEAVRRNRHVNVSFSDPGRNLFVSISGDARISNDRACIADLFTPMAKQFFPGGAEDPSIRLLIVEPLSAEYWDGPSGLTLLFRLAKSLFTGQPAEICEHEYLEL